MLDTISQIYQYIIDHLGTILSAAPNWIMAFAAVAAFSSWKSQVKAERSERIFGNLLKGAQLIVIARSPSKLIQEQFEQSPDTFFDNEEHVDHLGSQREKHKHLDDLIESLYEDMASCQIYNLDKKITKGIADMVDIILKWYGQYISALNDPRRSKRLKDYQILYNFTPDVGDATSVEVMSILKTVRPLLIKEASSRI